MITNAILSDLVAEIHATLGPAVANISVTRAVAGMYFTGVALDNGTAGVCHTPARTEIHDACCHTVFDPVLAPGTLRGRRATELLEHVMSSNAMHRALAIATLNALADACWKRQPHADVVLREDVDAFDAAAIRPGERVALVGAFIPFLRALKAMKQDYTVLELNPAMLKPEELPRYRPTAAAVDVLPHADVVLITGSTLVNGTADALLSLPRADARVVVVGPTVGMAPDAFLRRGVDIMGGIRVTAPDMLLDVLAEGGSGQHFFGRSAQRVVLVRRPVTPAVAA
ncbi:MAG: DUF364 domain-containing protein [Acetobacteraceae bacterium]